MKLLKLFLLLILIGHNHLFSMEAERKSLASFFSIDAFTKESDILQSIAHQYCIDKPWLYVDKQIQLCDRKISSVWFNKSGTKIQAWSLDDNCIYGWDRTGGKSLEESYSDNFCLSQNVGSNDEEEPSAAGSEVIISEYKGELFYHPHTQFDAQEVEWFNDKLSGKSEHIEMLPYKTLKIARMHSAVYIWDEVEKKEIAQLIHQARINSLCVNDISEKIVTTSDDCTMHLWNIKNWKELLQVIYDRPIVTAVFNELGTEIAVTTNDNMIHILAHYQTNNVLHFLNQMLLKQLFHIWLQVEKPSKTIDTPEILLPVIASLFCIDEKELIKIWLTFPENMQSIVWQSMRNKILRYGKEE